MVKRGLAAIIVGAAALTCAGDAAMAQSWFDFSPFRQPRPRVYYPGPDYMPGGPLETPYGGPVYGNQPAYGQPPFDESYYDPTIDRQLYGAPIARQKAIRHKVVKAKPAAAAPVDASATTTSDGPPPVRSAIASTATAGDGTAVPKAPRVIASAKPDAGTELITDSTSSTTTSAKVGLACDKAKNVVAGYGFSNIKAAACTGKTYAFNASRDGKSYSVKLDSASGELTEVKKVQ